MGPTNGYAGVGRGRRCGPAAQIRPRPRTGCRHSATLPDPQGLTSSTSAARASRGSSLRLSAPVDSSSTLTMMAGLMCFSWTAVRWLTRPSPVARATACTETVATERFEDVTGTSGIRHRDYGMGACAGDYDNDGLIDLYVTNVGRISSIAMPAAAVSPKCRTPAAPIRICGARAARFSTSIETATSISLSPTTLTRSSGKNDSAASPAAASQGLLSPTYLSALAQRPLSKYRTEHLRRHQQAEWRRLAPWERPRRRRCDVDDDGWPDVFVANDAMPNFLFHNQGMGRSLTSAA